LLSDDPEIAKLLNVGMVFQNGALFDSLTVGQNVGFLLYEHTKLNHSKIEVPPPPPEMMCRDVWDHKTIFFDSEE
jgi:hypothetical protein